MRRDWHMNTTWCLDEQCIQIPRCFCCEGHDTSFSPSLQTYFFTHINSPHNTHEPEYDWPATSRGFAKLQHEPHCWFSFFTKQHQILDVRLTKIESYSLTIRKFGSSPAFIDLNSRKTCGFQEISWKGLSESTQLHWIRWSRKATVTCSNMSLIMLTIPVSSWALSPFWMIHDSKSCTFPPKAHQRAVL